MTVENGIDRFVSSDIRPEKRPADVVRSPQPTNTKVDTLEWNNTAAFESITDTSEGNNKIHKDLHPLYQPNKKIKKKHIDPSILQFRVTIQLCCKNNDLSTAIQAYDNAIQNQTRIEAQSFYNLLSLCSNDFNDRSIHIGTPKTSTKVVASKLPLNEGETSKIDLIETSKPLLIKVVDDTTRRYFAERVKHHMDTMQLPLPENAYTAMVRLFCRTKEIQAAQQILNEAEIKLSQQQHSKVKLRLYTPLLQAYCELGMLLDAVKIWYRISTNNLMLTEVEYCSVIQCCCMVGNAIVLERVLSDLAEDILIPSHETRKSIIRWFESKHSIENRNIDTQNGDENSTLFDLLQNIKVPNEDSVTSMGPVQCDNEMGWSISDQCPIDHLTGIFQSGCLHGERLQPISISQITCNTMKQMNINIAITGKINENDTTNYQGGGKGRKMIIDERTVQQRQKHWEEFENYLLQFHSEKNNPIQFFIIDGANVGYYEQNFVGAPKHVDYHQIDWIVQYLVNVQQQQQHEQCPILLIMHSRHFATNLMPKYAKPIVQRWKDMNILYETPIGMNDDWFWLHAALHFGFNTYVVTNDEMRDHHFQMIAPRSFVRWRDRHQIHFTFGDWRVNQSLDNNNNNRTREVIFQYPDPYSRRIQRVSDGIVIPLPKSGDTNRFLDGIFTATNEPDDEMYVCIRPNLTKESDKE
jgi:mitochondrial ribonuclease P protein 3